MSQLLALDGQNIGASASASVLPMNIQSSFPLGRASFVVQLVKNSPAMQETRVQSLGREDPLKKEMATHSRILAREIPWTEEPSRL